MPEAAAFRVCRPRSLRSSFLSNSLFTLRGRDFLSIADLQREELLDLVELGLAFKRGQDHGRPLAGRHVVLLFQKPSMRTRVSFEVGVNRLGGQPVSLGELDVQVGRRETVEDAARVLERYVHLIVARMRSHAELESLAAASAVPVVNALTELEHPCQVLADLLTLREHRDRLESCHVAYVGDGNNIVTSLCQAQALVGFHLTVITPQGYEPAAAVQAAAPQVRVTNDIQEVTGADAVYTDVWTSMGREAEREQRREAFAGYQVDQRVMGMAPGAIFLHCLPAHRGEEVADEVIDGPCSRVFDQAENRLHAQMALMARLMPQPGLR
jgi:ornithine carbamoyltransferase